MGEARVAVAGNYQILRRVGGSHTNRVGSTNAIIGQSFGETGGLRKKLPKKETPRSEELQHGEKEAKERCERFSSKNRSELQRRVAIRVGERENPNRGTVRAWGGQYESKKRKGSQKGIREVREKRRPWPIAKRFLKERSPRMLLSREKAKYQTGGEQKKRKRKGLGGSSTSERRHTEVGLLHTLPHKIARKINRFNLRRG